MMSATTYDPYHCGGSGTGRTFTGLMGGYGAGSDPLLDQAVKSAPRLYEAMMQSLASEPCLDPFIDLASALRGEARADEAAEGPAS